MSGLNTPPLIPPQASRRASRIPMKTSILIPSLPFTVSTSLPRAIARKAIRGKNDEVVALNNGDINKDIYYIGLTTNAYKTDRKKREKT